jgi:hypothetical protein
VFSSHFPLKFFLGRRIFFSPARGGDGNGVALDCSREIEMEWDGMGILPLLIAWNSFHRCSFIGEHGSAERE